MRSLPQNIFTKVRSWRAQSQGSSWLIFEVRQEDTKTEGTLISSSLPEKGQDSVPQDVPWLKKRQCQTD